MNRIESISTQICGALTRHPLYGFLPVGPGSLLRRARSSRREAEHITAPSRVQRWARTLWRLPLLKDGCFYGVALAGLLPTIPFSFPAFNDVTTSRLVLSTLWMVEASTLALSIAIIVFALQSFANSAPGAGSLKEVVEDSHLLWLIRLGIAGLLIDGAVLAGLRGSPVGWPATWAFAVSAASIPTLPVALRWALTSIDPNALHVRRLRRLRSRVEAAVEAQMLEVLARGHLGKWAEDSNFTVESMLRQVPAGWHPVPAPRGARVVDLNLVRLNRLSTTATLGPRQTKALLFVQLGDRVQAGSALCALPPESTARQLCTAASAFRLRP